MDICFFLLLFPHHFLLNMYLNIQSIEILFCMYIENAVRLFKLLDRHVLKSAVL